jgi:hypothetical protein
VEGQGEEQDVINVVESTAYTLGTISWVTTFILAGLRCTVVGNCFIDASGAQSAL